MALETQPSGNLGNIVKLSDILPLNPVIGQSVVIDLPVSASKDTSKDTKYIEKTGRHIKFKMQDNMQSVLRKYNPKIAPCVCGNVLGAIAPIMKNSNDKFRFAGISTCKSIVCPVCATRKSEHRKNEVKTIIDEHKKRYGSDNSVFLLTQTIPHKVNDTLADVLSALQLGNRKMRSSYTWKLLKQLGMLHNITALEFTYGQNGWHPHLHTLVLMDGSTPDFAKAFDRPFYTKWRNVMAKQNRPINSHGTDIRDGSFAAEYVSKWGLEHELTKGNVKTGKKGSTTYFQMLLQPKQYADLILEFYLATRGKATLRFSKGCREFYGLDVISDDEIFDEQQDAEIFINVQRNDYNTLRRLHSIAHIEDYCSNHTKQQVMREIADIINLDTHPPP